MFRLLSKYKFGIFDFLKSDKPKKQKIDPTSWKSLQYVLDDVRRANERKQKLLPIRSAKYEGKLTVIFEIDETLIYSFSPDEKEMFINAPLRNYDYYVDLPEFNDFVHIYKREHFDNFMKYLMNETEPILWTKADKRYVDRIVPYVFPDFPKEQIFTQNECNLIEYDEEEDFIKDFNLLGRDRSNSVYIDCNPLSFWTFGSNSYLIDQFYADNTDYRDQLYDLINSLEDLRKVDDVRTVLGPRFKVLDFMKESKMID